MSSTLTLRGPTAVRMRFLAGLVSLPNALAIGTVTTTAAGTPATATITGTAPTQTLNLTVPKGDQGVPGTPSTVPGPANTLSIGTVTTGAAGTAAAATITGTAPTQTLNLTIPRGTDGTSLVTSVAGKTGAVTLVKADVGLDQVDNTSDVNKPVSTAQATSIATRVRFDTTQSLTSGQIAQALSNIGAYPFLADGCCRLTKVSATQIKLSQQNGSCVFVNGQPTTVPAAGLTLSNAGAPTSTFAYIYYSGTALAFSTTGYTVDAVGRANKTGDTTQRLVGMVYFDASGTFFAVSSYFNRRELVFSQTVTGSTASSAYINIGNPIVFITWADEAVVIETTGYAYNNAGGGYFFNTNYIDGGQVGGNVQSSTPSSCAIMTAVAPGVLSEGMHQANAYGLAYNGGTSTWVGNIWVRIKG